MRLKWFFREKPAKNSSERLAFRVKLNWKPPSRQPVIKMFLSKLEKRKFSVFLGTPQDYNLSKEEWLAMRGLAEHHNIIIKLTDKRSCLVARAREDYLAEADRQLVGKEIHENSSVMDAELVKLVEKSNIIFNLLKKEFYYRRSV